MKNIFIEGIQGMGKSTLLQQIANIYPGYQVCREGDYSPIELAWCAWMNEEEYKAVLERYCLIQNEIQEKTVREGTHYIVSYTQIITDIHGFHKDLEKYEIYNGRKSLQELEQIVITRYQQFSGKGYLFECSFFQNIVEDLILFHQLSDDEIVEFYHRLYNVIQDENFLLLYLYSDDIAENIRIIQKERVDNQGNQLWYPLMLEYLVQSPYGKQHGYKDFDDMISHFNHRQNLELRIINEVLKENAIILPAKQWKTEELHNLIKENS